MASRRICIHSHGYTLVEVLIVIGLILMLMGLSMFIDLHNYFGGAFRSEQNTLITLLQTARADALNNVDELPHGVAAHPADHPQSYVVFEGASYGASDEESRRVFEAAYPVLFDAASPSEIVFCQLSGDATSGVSAGTDCEDPVNAFDGNIVMTDTVRQLTLSIFVNHEGSISW